MGSRRWGSRGSGYRYWIWICTHQAVVLDAGGLDAGGLDTGGLEACATDFGSGSVLIR